jgi:hypothetical protein
VGDRAPQGVQKLGEVDGLVEQGEWLLTAAVPLQRLEATGRG